MATTSLERKGFILSHRLQSPTEGRQGRNLRQELESETDERMLLSGLLPGSPVATFLTRTMPIYLGKIPPTVGQALLHQINNKKKCFSDITTR